MKKIVSAALASLMLAAAPMGVLAEAYGTGLTRTVMPISEMSPAQEDISEENRLKQVLTQVKLLIDIPEEYTEFDYSLNTRYEDEQWYFTWRTKDNMKYLSVNADGDGRITYYNNNIRPNKVKAPTILRADALAIAKAFIVKLYPDIIDQLDESETVGTYFGSNAYQFHFTRQVNGILYGNNYVEVSVDHTDGRVKTFSIGWEHDVEFDDPTNRVTTYMAIKKWKSDSALDLKYRIFSNYENGEYKDTVAKLVYINRDTQKNILALTGEYLEENYGWASGGSANDKLMFDATAEAPAQSESVTNSSASRVEFSENELKRMEELDNYISTEEADKIVRAYTQLAIDDSFTLSSYSNGYSYQPYTDTNDRPIVWNLVYTGTVREGDFSPLTARASVNAETGELISFSSYRYYDHFDSEGNFVKPVLAMELEEAQKLADSFLQKVQPEKYKDLSFASSRNTNSFTYVAKEYGKDDTENDGVYYTSVANSYNRTHNDIQVMGNSASVTVDCVEGKITNYSLNWTDGLTFDSEKAVVDENTALETYFDSADVELEYIHYTVYLYDEAADEKAEKEVVYSKYHGGDVIETRDETRLIYSFNAPFYAVSALTGKPITYDGTDYEKNVVEKFEGYSDISGHWAEEQIKLLSDIGVILRTDSFRPDEAISQKEFIAMLMAVTNNYTEVLRYADIDKFMEAYTADMTYNGYYIPEKDEDIQPDSPIMRKDAAKFIVRGMGYEKVATLGSIFKTDFIDNDSIDPSYIGYAALASALGVVNGSHGCFNGDENITRAESAILIYNYMNAEK